MLQPESAADPAEASSRGVAVPPRVEGPETVDSRAVASPRVLLLIPSYAKCGIEAAVAEGRHPTMDYHALQAVLGAAIADYASVDADPHPLVRAARAGGHSVALAVHGFVRRRNFESIFANGENVGIPLAALLASTRSRPGHVLIGHRLSPRKKRLFLRALNGYMDGILVYAGTQRDHAISSLGIPQRKVHLVPFHADHRFYRPMPGPEEKLISSAGLEWRDYPTLVTAVDGLDVDVHIAAASPWSKHRNETANMALPRNVHARPYDYEALRELYARSRFVVVPLYDNDFQAGVTTILEAMAMGKAVIATQTQGQRDVIENGTNGLYVPPGNAAALREAIVRLLGSPAEAARLGAAARRTIEERMTLDHWAARVAQVVRAAARWNHGGRVDVGRGRALGGPV